MKIFQCEHGIQKRLPVPGDVFISHFALVTASIKSSDTIIENLCLNGQVETTVTALGQLGVCIDLDRTASCAVVHGVGRYGFTPPSSVIDCKNSRETLYLLSAVLSAQNFECILSGGPSLCRQSADQLIRSLNAVGADLYSENGGLYPPLHIRGRSKLTGWDVLPNREYPLLLKACLLLAGLYSDSEPALKHSAHEIDHPERLLRNMDEDTFFIPGDFTYAAHFLSLGAILPGSRIVLENVSINESRTYFLDVLKDLGAEISVENFRIRNGEPTADLTITAAPLTHRDITSEEFEKIRPVLLPLALTLIYASGNSSVNGLSDLDLSELDRLDCFVDNAKWMRGHLNRSDYTLKIKGGTALTGAAIQTYSDPQLIMIFAIAALVANGSTILDAKEGLALPWPGFLETVQDLS